MSDKEVIVREIRKWQKNRMLPEHYCQFLLKLYADEPAAAKQQPWGKAAAWTAFFMLLIAAVFLLPVPPAALTASAATLAAGVSAYHTRAGRGMLHHLFTTAGALFLLAAAIQWSAWMMLTPGQTGMMTGAAAAVWLAAGLFFKRVYLIAAGGAGLAVLLFFILAGL
ncbi:hypothetical protein [Alkalicoccus luteus]|uniref:hypothetical protein n=1 Tax=Alkalicoccus luteus TaxID=1237094 RepID=UPI004034EADE